ncbi:MAG: 16S rRNA methyltransferase [Thermoplasmata archaeon]
MLHLILADAELELVPEELWNHPSVINVAQRRGKKPRNILLDSTFHHTAIRAHFKGEENRRGRPDITHYFLLNSLESPLNLKNGLRVYVHTRNNEVIFIRPETRIPKSYNRFVGLIEELFHNGYVPSKNDPLLWIEKLNIKDLLRNIGEENVLVLCSKGEKKRIYEIIEKDQAVIIGGFPSGTFISDIKNFKKVSIFDVDLTAWVTAYEVIANYEFKFSIL